MKDNRKENDGIASLYKGLDKFIGVIAEMMENQKDEINLNGIINDPEAKKKLTASYGVNIKLGPNNIGDLKEKNIRPQNQIEPSIDIFDEADRTLIIMELPEIRKEDIQLEVQGNELIVKACSKSTLYSKRIPLKFNINLDDIEININNSICSIAIKKNA